MLRNNSPTVAGSKKNIDCSTYRFIEMEEKMAYQLVDTPMNKSTSIEVNLIKFLTFILTCLFTYVIFSHKIPRSIRITRRGQHVIPSIPQRDELSDFNDADVSGVLQVKLLTKDAFIPTRATSGSAGLDLKSPDNFTVGGRSSLSIDLHLAFKIPDGFFGQLAGRSSLAFKSSVTVMPGVIDQDFVGGVSVLLYNNGSSPYRVRRGSKIAQLLCIKIAHPSPVLVSTLPHTERGCQGFGSSGI